MALTFGDNIYTKTFSPQEYLIELLNTAKSKNVIFALEGVTNKIFVVLKLIQELAFTIHRNLKTRKWTLLVLEETEIERYVFCITHLTDLKPLVINSLEHLEINNYEVLVTTDTVCLEMFEKQFLDIDRLNLAIFNDCHKIVIKNSTYYKICNFIKPYCSCKIVGIVHPLFKTDVNPAFIESQLKFISNKLNSSIETAGDIVSLLRHCCKPKEILIECAFRTEDCTDNKIKSIIKSLTDFLNDHRFEPASIYEDDEEYGEELKQIPNPKNKPLQVIADFLNVLKTMGPYCADKAALTLLYTVEKLKVKIPYERHFILFCIVSTLLIQIRAIFDDIFHDYSNEDKIIKFSSPRVLRMISILKQFKPKSFKVDIINEAFIGQKEKKNAVIKSKSVRRNWKLARRYGTHKKQGRSRDVYEENVCAIILVNNKITASILYYLLLDLKNSNKEDYGWIQPQYTVDKEADPITEPKEFEIEHKKQEETLRRFRHRECNVLIGTKVLEEGIDLPRCNLVINYNTLLSYKSYLLSKSRAKTLDAYYILMFDEDDTSNILSRLQLYKEINIMLLSHCTLKDIDIEKENYTNRYNWCVKPFKPGKKDDAAFVDMATAIGLVNRYCAKLPSDTFTKLSPIWKIQSVVYENQAMFVCNIRLPINSPIKHDIHGHPMPSEILAKRIAALEVCRQLHFQGELDDTLQPITKESFHALFNADEVPPDAEDALIPWDTEEPRPGTNKRRQYYYKRIAEALNNCRPLEGEPCHLYTILLNMNCPVPEEQNTRGRRIHPPEESIHGFGILTTKHIPSIPPFPIYTRCGEVYVSLKLIKTNLLLTQQQLDDIATFLNYTFTNVLRLQKCHVAFDPNTTHNCYYIAPTLKDINGSIDIDWEFLDNMHKNKDKKLNIISNEDRANFQPDIDVLKDAVVTPWYRNHEQPQYFYVAEICNHLNPKSPFPGSLENYKTFEDYYYLKYNLKIQNPDQPLLDVDHTSARLNFLTPRYMNRKGVILPTSSDATKRAKRDNLSQKQILVPELCNIHLFPASMWRKAVSLPCILYRINALLLADEIRSIVANDISLGSLNLSYDHIWEPLDFGWTMKEVLKKRREQKENSVLKALQPVEIFDKLINEEIIEEHNVEKSDDPNFMDIGIWSNDMAEFAELDNENDVQIVRYSSPTSWSVHSENESSSISETDLDDRIQEDGLHSCGLRIEFRNTYLAEAVDENYSKLNKLSLLKNNKTLSWSWNDCSDSVVECKPNETDHKLLNIFYKKDDEIIINREIQQNYNIDNSNLLKLPWELNPVSGYGLPDTKILPSNLLTDLMNNTVTNIRTQAHNTNINNVNKIHFIPTEKFSFDFQPNLDNHPGPSPSVLLQALTMSNANDGINLERLETIGDSFLKYAITAYLYCTHDNVHEGKLSHLRSKQVSNLNLYRLGKLKMFGERMISTKFEPHDNWLPPCYFVPHKLEKALINAGIPTTLWNMITLPTFKDSTDEEIEEAIRQFKIGFSNDNIENAPLFVPYNLVTQHSIPDKSIADCVEALIGAYLISCGARGALLFMSWLGIKVLPMLDDSKLGYLKPPSSPLLRNIPDPESELLKLMNGFESFEEHLGYHFRDRSYLLQAMTHASYYPNRLTDCYQRLEFLGDAVLDYLITRHLYEDKRQHSPGALTDLRSALVNNTIFASLAVRNGFHKYFKHLSPGLSDVVCRFVTIQEENGHTIDEEFYFMGEDECEEAEDVEVPKALGDVFESVAGAIYLDSNMSLDTVWKVYHKIMENEMELFSTNVPKSPIRELLELEPETAKFSKPEKLADGRRVRVVVEIFGKGEFKGIGRNYRIAKCTAAKCALKHLKKKK